MSDRLTIKKEDDIFSDYPKYTAGRITWAVLFAIVAWRNRHGVASISADDVREYRDEGYGPSQAGLEMGLIDYGQATGIYD